MNNDNKQNESILVRHEYIILELKGLILRIGKKIFASISIPAICVHPDSKSRGREASQTAVYPLLWQRFLDQKFHLECQLHRQPTRRIPTNHLYKGRERAKQKVSRRKECHPNSWSLNYSRTWSSHLARSSPSRFFFDSPVRSGCSQ